MFSPEIRIATPAHKYPKSRAIAFAALYLSSAFAGGLAGAVPARAFAQAAPPVVPRPPQTTRDQLETLRPPTTIAPDVSAERPRIETREINPACPFASTDDSITLETLSIRDLPAGYGSSVTEVFSPKVGIPLVRTELCDLRDQLASILQREGLIARIDIVPQTLSENKLTLIVTVAVIEDVEYVGETRYRLLLTHLAEDFIRLRPFDSNKADEIFQRMHTIAGGRQLVSTSLVPHPDGRRGQVRMRVKVLPAAPYTSQVQLNNQGQIEYGEYVAAASVANLTSKYLWGELSAFYSANYGDKAGELTTYGMDYGFFRSKAADRVSIGYSKTNGLIGGDSAILELGIGFNQWRLGYQRPLISRPTSFFALDVKIDRSQQDTRLFGFVELISETSANASVELAGGRLVRIAKRPVSINGALSISKGLPFEGVSKTGSELLANPSANPLAFVNRGRLDLSFMPTQSTRLDFRSSFQYTQDALVGVEKFSAGDRLFGRGLQAGALTGDVGYGTTLELVHALPHTSLRALGLEMCGFVDHAFTQTLGIGKANNDITTVGLGLRGQYKGFQINGFAADPVGSVADGTPVIKLSVVRALPQAQAVAQQIRTAFTRSRDHFRDRN